mmetsp:Transcript_55589/g.131982  ORF Transcript_55589/g.131982 Transcript_55589/m.131982 type:complete len:217 (-) Transcript_55589:1400-2050(-)
MSRSVISGVPDASATWLVVNARSAASSPAWLRQLHAKSGGRGESEAALRLRSEHWSMVVGPDTEREGSLRNSGAATLVASLGESRETRLAERTEPALSVSLSPGTSVAPTPRKTLSVRAVAHTHLGAVMPDILAKAVSSAKTWPQDRSLLLMDARLVLWSKVTASWRPSWSIAMVEMTGAVQKVKGEEAPREASVRDTTASSTAATPPAYEHEAHS